MQPPSETAGTTPTRTTPTDTITWVDGTIELVDQTVLPQQEVVLRITAVSELVAAIRRLSVRGAPALGVAGAYGVALALATVAPEALDEAIEAIRTARPTAINLARMTDRVAARVPDGFAAVLAEAHAVREEEIAASIDMGTRGADLVEALLGGRDVRAMTICNTGGLAAVRRGTALAVVQTLHERGRLADCLALETRPLLQGARLTAWELGQMGAPHHLVVDSAAPFLLSRGAADVVLAGADRIAVNGDTANKVGTFSLALAAQHAGVPLIVVAPESTIDHATPDGAAIPIEDRGPAEVGGFGSSRTAPPDTPALNPAFDVTPAALIHAIVTDKRVVMTSRGQTP
ncbi:MAG: S-methyl-5-thioribose-1-phosphate isomerase [Actinomycetota bacterium]